MKLSFGCFPALHLDFLCKRRGAQLAQELWSEPIPGNTPLCACVGSLLMIIVAPFSVQRATFHRLAQLLLIHMAWRRSAGHTCCEALTGGEGLNP